jgi:hypothetical protein
MKTVSVSPNEPAVEDLLSQARGEDIVVKLADGSEFLIAAIDDFDRELVATRANEKLMQFLDQRAAQEKAIPLAVVKRRLGIG